MTEGPQSPPREMKSVCMSELELLTWRKIPFGLKSGGHISIPKIRPSNDGILVAMRKFDHIAYNKEKKTLDVGAGVLWRDVYKYLEQFQADRAPGVVGGDPLVGVSGWILGGGYSLQTNRFGLGIDNIVGFRVLLPGAKSACNVSQEENPELFKALKGGGHNFGIITQFTLRVHDHAPRTKPIVSFEFPESASSIVKNVLVDLIQAETPPELVFVVAFRHDLKNGELKVKGSCYSKLFLASYLFLDAPETRDLVRFFFNGRNQSPGSDEDRSMSLAEAYEAFSLRHLPVSLETLQTGSHFVHLDASLEIGGITLNSGDLIERHLFTGREGTEIDRSLLTTFTAGNKTVVMEKPPDARGRMACIMVSTYTRTLIDEAEKQAKNLASLMKDHQGIRVSFEIWPFHKDAFNGISRGDTAWPHEQGKVFGPLVGWFDWSGKDNDNFWLKEITKALKELRKVALKEKCTTENMPMYLNITLEDTPVKDIYRDHYEKLKSLRRKYDQNNVMGLAAGFVIDINEA
ncbi:Bifunctional solanapyrone synthase [Leucoagaricus sp. SymC.cos]|nr:Bifunctional solanapyrone synthase [Leucoagaricus sp. SymC.cos]